MNGLSEMVRYVPPLDKKERHLDKMNFAGPGTNVRLRMKMGVKPMDSLDKACFQHDLATEPRGPYTSRGNPKKLRAADRKLMNRCDELILRGYRPIWKAIVIRNAMEFLLRTGARGRK